MGAPKTPSTTTQIQKVELPKWVENASQQNYAFAQQIANKPLVQYGGKTVADVSPSTQAAWDLLAANPNPGADAYDAASQGYLGVYGAQTPQVEAGALANTDLTPYLNPYTQNVINNALRDLNTTTTQQIGANADKALAAGAFGGSRGAITDAITRSEAIKAAGDLSDKMNADNFTQAQGAATGDLNRSLQGALSNQSALMQAQQNQLAASQGMAGIGDSQVKSLLQQYMGLSDAGTKQQAQQQAVLDAAKGKFDEANNYDLDRLNILLSSLGMSPYGKTSTTTTTQPKSGGTDWAQAGLGVLSIFGGLFGASDRRVKKNIKRVGRNRKLDIPIFEYNYKGDAPGTPKIVGPMAQDVEKKFPKAVTEINGVKHVRRDALTGITLGALAA